ncbi:MAG: hypothetical protein QOG01_1945, partial [Pseudonocardiales bacterium]|nr:hypothetical protein [Pseudonocardiales bacterium]
QGMAVGISDTELAAPVGPHAENPVT